MSLEPERCRVTPGFPAAPEKKQAKRQMIAVQHLPEIFRRISEVEQLSPKSAIFGLADEENQSTSNPSERALYVIEELLVGLLSSL